MHKSVFREGLVGPVDLRNAEVPGTRDLPIAPKTAPRISNSSGCSASIDPKLPCINKTEIPGPPFAMMIPTACKFQAPNLWPRRVACFLAATIGTLSATPPSPLNILTNVYSCTSKSLAHSPACSQAPVIVTTSVSRVINSKLGHPSLVLTAFV